MPGKITIEGISPVKFSGRVGSQILADDILGRAAQLAYYFLLALFPLLLFLVSLLGFFTQHGSEMRADLLRYFSLVLPGSAFTLISDVMNEVSASAGGGKLSFGLIAALWAASSGIDALCSALNVAYGVTETRSFWRVRLRSLWLTIAISVLIIGALMLIFSGGDIGGNIATTYGLGKAFKIFWNIAQIPLVLLSLYLAFSLLYHFAPDMGARPSRWFSMGATVGVVLWLLVSFGFRLYLHFFNSYSATYGSLGALIVLVLWFYFTGLALLIGGEVDSELTKLREENEQAAAGADATTNAASPAESSDPTRARTDTVNVATEESVGMNAQTQTLLNGSRQTAPTSANDKYKLRSTSATLPSKVSSNAPQVRQSHHIALRQDRSAADHQPQPPANRALKVFSSAVVLALSWLIVRHRNS